MKTLARHSSTLKPDRVFSVLVTELDDTFSADDLFNAFLQRPAYDRDLLLKLLAVAQGNSGDSWEVRRLAILMLEHQVLKIPPENLEEFDFLLTQLKLKPNTGSPLQVTDTVLKEGFSTTDLCGFSLELRRKLERLNQVHNQIKGSNTTARAMKSFIALSQRECKLSLARYIFTPNEVVDRILKQVSISKGLIDLDISQPASIEEEDEHTLARMPSYEARILDRLRQTHHIYWVSDSTSSELNSLVEYPLTTVVIVVKPPGSSFEFEIKRAGRRGRYPLGVVHSRDGEMVPPSHRLDGGSTQWLLRYESRSVSRLAGLYRTIHGTEAPLPTFHSRSSVYSVPVAGNEENILEYFTKPAVFGPAFREMRVAMRDVTAAFDDEGRSQSFEIPGDVGLTMQFLGHASPTQGIMSGTSSFRLDRLAAYLSDDGPETYFRDGLKAIHSSQDDQRLADEVLEEVLCSYRPPAVRYRNYRQYLDAAFKISENRAQADHNFSSAMQQIGKFWGTLLALRGSTNGESFVPRNVGLRSVWDQGQWQLKVIFMDHDNLNLADPTVENFQSLGAHAGTALDEIYIWGIYDGIRHTVGAVDCLEIIYRSGSDTSRQGKELFRTAMSQAYRKTHCELERNPLLRERFHPSFVERIRDWDLIARTYLQINGQQRGHDIWKEETTKTFIERGYDKNLVLEHLITTERYGKFLERYAFLY